MVSPSRKKRRTRRRGSNTTAGNSRRHGVAAVEFAVTSPFLIIIFLGAVDMGQYISVGQAVHNASREAARLAARNDTGSVMDVEDRVATYFSAMFPNTSAAKLDPATQVVVRNADGNIISGSALATIDTGSAVSVQVVFEFDAVRWLSGAGTAKGQNVNVTTAVRRE